LSWYSINIAHSRSHFEYSKHTARWTYWTIYILSGLSWAWSYGSWIYNYPWNQCISPLMLWVQISIRVRCSTLYDKVCQWLTTGRWFSPGPPVSSTNKTDFLDITWILLKVALKPSNKTKKINILSALTLLSFFCVINILYLSPLQ
jgi:hypothetical protein